MKGAGSAYKASMEILAKQNVSSMPIECFSPVQEWPRDLRVTTAVRPEQLIAGYTQLVCAIDDIVAAETKAQWLHNDDVQWLDKLGLAGKVEGLNSWGRANRIQTRLQEIFSLAGQASVPENVKRTASLITLRHTWSQVSADERQKLVTKLTGRNKYDPNEKLSEVIEYLFNRQGYLSNLPPLPDDVKSMLVELAKHPLPNEHGKPELQAVATAELLQGVSLLGNEITDVQKTLKTLDRSQYFGVLAKTVEQVKVLEI